MRAGLSYPEWGTATGEYAIKLDAELAQGKLTTLEYVEKLGSSPLLFSPGEDYSYSTCADVLGGLVEKTSGLSFRDFLMKYIINPLGLKNTDFLVKESDKNRIAKGYITDNGKLKAILNPSLGIYANGDKNPFESGGAGLFMTLDDLSRYAQCLLNKSESIISEDSFKKMVEPEYTKVVSKRENGYIYYNLMRHMAFPEECQQECTLGEFGWDGALGTFILIDPTNKITLVIAFQSFDEKKWEYVWKIKHEVFKYLKYEK